MTIKELTIFLEGKKKNYQKNRENIALLSALDTVALMKRRVINQRLNAEGGIFGIYSDSYNKTRKQKNLLGDNINFSYTNEMWNSTTARIVSKTDNEIVVLISPSKAQLFKMFYNTEKFGTILALNEKEAAIHRSIYQSKFNAL